MVFILNSMADFFLAVLFLSFPSCVALVSFRFHWRREKTNSLLKTFMRTPVRLSGHDNDILLKKTISRISNVSKTSFKKNLFVLGRIKMRSGQGVTEKLTTTWLTFTRAYLPWQGYFIKEGSFLSPQNI